MNLTDEELEIVICALVQVMSRYNNEATKIGEIVEKIENFREKEVEVIE